MTIYGHKKNNKDKRTLRHTNTLLRNRISVALKNSI